MKVKFEHLCGYDIRITITYNDTSVTFVADTHISGFPENLINMLIRILKDEDNISRPIQIIAQTIEIYWLADRFRIVTEAPYIYEYATSDGTIIDLEINRWEFCIAMWRGLCELETKIYLCVYDDYLSDWIPFDSLQILTDLIKQNKDNS